MLTAVKNQLKVTLLSIKYSVMRNMINKFTFISNILFMVLNNASMIVQWLVIYSIKDSVGSYSLKMVILLWGFASATYGVSHFFFKNAFDLSGFINSGRLDTMIVQPKNILLTTVTTDVSISAIGDLIYGYIMLFVYGFTPLNFLLFTLLSITGGLITASIAVISGSLAFWFGKSDAISNTTESITTMIATYPEDIFNTIIKVIIYTIIPVAFIVYVPVNIMEHLTLLPLLGVLGFTTAMIMLAYIVFYSGLKRYSSTNLMNART